MDRKEAGRLKHIIHTARVCLALLVMACLLALPVQAKTGFPAFDTTAPLSLTVTARSSGQALAGVDLKLVRVADMGTNAGSLVVTPLEGFPDSLTNYVFMHNGDLERAARSCRTALRRGASGPSWTGTTDSAGRAVFAGSLTPGLYLLVQTGTQARVDLAPALISLPQWDSAEGDWVYSAQALPKIEPEEPDEPDEPDNPPDKPDKPDNPPDKPDQPDNPPDKPDQPDNPPDTPDQPDNPSDTPDHPSQPPEQPAQPPGTLPPAVSGQAQVPAPATGDAARTELCLLALTTSAALALKALRAGTDRQKGSRHG